MEALKLPDKSPMFPSRKVLPLPSNKANHKVKLDDGLANATLNKKDKTGLKTQKQKNLPPLKMAAKQKQKPVSSKFESDNVAYFLQKQKFLQYP